MRIDGAKESFYRKKFTRRNFTNKNRGKSLQGKVLQGIIILYKQKRGKYLHGIFIQTEAKGQILQKISTEIYTEILHAN